MRSSCSRAAGRSWSSVPLGSEIRADRRLGERETVGVSRATPSTWSRAIAVSARLRLHRNRPAPLPRHRPRTPPSDARSRSCFASWCYPRAQENDGERAVRAALAIQRRSPTSTPATPRPARRNFPPASGWRAGGSWSIPQARCPAMRKASVLEVERWNLFSRLRGHATRSRRTGRSLAVLPTACETAATPIRHTSGPSEVGWYTILRQLLRCEPQPSTYLENAKACRAASSIWASSALSLRSRQTLMSLPTPPPILTKGSMTTAPL